MIDLNEVSPQVEVIILPDAASVAHKASALVTAMIDIKPQAVLGLATGATPLMMYQNLISAYQAGAVSFAGVHSFNLDEYLGLVPDHRQSYRAYMFDRLFQHIDINVAHTHVPTCVQGKSPHAAGALYEKKISAAGGIDLQVLGIGSNGHIGFNEPSSSLASRTRVKTLDIKTLEDNRHLFRADEYQPELAITMGIGTILEARRIMLLATGSRKSVAVATMIEGALSAQCPATALQMHESVTVLLDEAAASQLQHRDYYHWVYAQNEKLNEVFGTRLTL